MSVVGDVSSITSDQKAKLAEFGIDLDSIVSQAKANGTFQATAPTVVTGTDAAAAFHSFFGESTIQDATSALERLAALHQAGSLTDDEFTEAKRKLLS